METRCQKCGAPVGADHAFWPRCGAVVGMGGAEPERDEGWDMAATMVGQKLPAAPRPQVERPPEPAVSAAVPQAEPRKSGNAVLLAVLGFVAVLLVGGLLVLLLYLSYQG